MKQEAHWGTLTEDDQISYVADARDEANAERKELKTLGYTQADDQWPTEATILEEAKELAWNASDGSKAELADQRRQDAAQRTAQRIAELKREHDAYHRGKAVVNCEEYALEDCSPFIREFAKAAAEKYLYMCSTDDGD